MEDLFFKIASQQESLAVLDINTPAMLGKLLIRFHDQIPGMVRFHDHDPTGATEG